MLNRKKCIFVTDKVAICLRLWKPLHRWPCRDNRDCWLMHLWMCIVCKVTSCMLVRWGTLKNCCKLLPVKYLWPQPQPVYCVIPRAVKNLQTTCLQNVVEDLGWALLRITCCRIYEIRTSRFSLYGSSTRRVVKQCFLLVITCLFV